MKLNPILHHLKKLTWNGSKTPRRNVGKKVNIGSGNDFGHDSGSTNGKTTKNKRDYIKLKKLLSSKTNTQQNEKAVYWMEGNVCKLYVRYGVDI